MRNIQHVLFNAILIIITITFAGCGDSKIKDLYDNSELLYSTGTLEKKLGTAGMVVIDARSATAYNAGHIPGSINMIFGDYRTAAGLIPVDEIETKLSAAGISSDMTIIIYDNTVASWGAAGRIFWMLEYLGCSKVRILNGGWDKWIAEERSTETTVNTLTPTTFTAVVNDDVRSTKEYILSRMDGSDFAIIDSRTDEEFNGWTLYGETRGGHIPGAVQIPYEWFFNTDKTILGYDDLKALFESRGITKDKEITAHCTAGIRSGFVYFALRLMGYTNISNYDASILDWSAADESTYPMEKMTNYQMLVNASWVQTLIAGGNTGSAGTPVTYSGNGYLIIEASSNRSSDNTANYLTGHIPGALYFNIYRMEPDWPNYPYDIWSEGNLAADDDLESVIASLGISSDTTVVVYSRNPGASQPFRLAWALLYAGVDDVRVLNGGLDAWEAIGGTMETTSNDPTPSSFTITSSHSGYVATTAEVNTMRTDANSVLGDMRSWEEYIGEENPYLHAGFSGLGRIPGAKWIQEPSWYFDNDSTLKNYIEIQEMWDEAGVTSDKAIAFYCGTGWRSSLGFMLGYMMGYADVKNYDSGFYGWSYDYNDPQNPIDTGE